MLHREPPGVTYRKEDFNHNIGEVVLWLRGIYSLLEVNVENMRDQQKYFTTSHNYEILIPCKHTKIEKI